MFDINDRRRIYWLIDKYLIKDIDTLTFSQEYRACFDLTEQTPPLSDFEENIMCELSDVAGRFSEFESDHHNHPGAFYTEEEVRQKAIEVKKKLADYWPYELREK